MKNLMIIFVCLINFSAFSSVDCYEEVLHGHTRDSANYQIFSPEVSELFESNSNAASLQSILLLEKKLGCLNRSFTIHSVNCKQIMPREVLSKVCFVQSKSGYFFISIDMMENINITFNRFD